MPESEMSNALRREGLKRKELIAITDVRCNIWK
jgi:hypothetical protein